MIEKAVFSFWSKPFYKEGVRNNAGFIDMESFYCSWFLSVQLAKKHFKKVVLYTDYEGLKILKPLNLPFDEVHLDLQALKEYDVNFWAIGKVYTYSLQKEPFLHLDFDVFLWDGIKNFNKSKILIQSIEDEGWPYYTGIIKEYYSNSSSIDNEVSKFIDRYGFRTYAYNCGVFGGTDINYIQRYTKGALKIATEGNSETWVQDLCYNLFFEQHYAGIVADNLGITPTCILGNKVRYTHLLSECKKDKGVSRKLKKRIAKDFPIDYLKIKLLLMNGHTINS